MRGAIISIMIAGCLISLAEAEEIFTIGAYPSYLHTTLQRANSNNTMELITSMEGENEGDAFGRSVSGGDFNGDGYSDVIVGAKWWNGTIENYLGRAYIFLGGPDMDSIPDLVLTGEETHNYFGISVSNAGDVNGDSVEDWVIGASGYGDDNGKVYIYYGGNPLDSLPDVVAVGQANSHFGAGVSTAGDVNGDGYDDVIISSFTGDILILHGGEDMDSIPDWEVSFGTEDNVASTAGDVNGDGYDDVVMASGEMRIYFGGPDMDTIPDVVYPSLSKASGCGDVNNDGYSDVVAGTEYVDPRWTQRLFLGGPSMDAIPDLNFYIGASRASISGAGDVNSDGFDDVILGNPYYHYEDGKVVLFLGGDPMNNFADVILYGSSCDNFGGAVSGAGDVNGDGYDDIVVGQPGHYLGNERVFVFAGDSGIIDGIEEDDNYQLTLSNYQLSVYPNPFREKTSIQFIVNGSEFIGGNCQIIIYDLTGRLVRTFPLPSSLITHHKITWDGRDESENQLPSGLYFCEIKSDKYREVGKITLLK